MTKRFALLAFGLLFAVASYGQTISGGSTVVPTVLTDHIFTEKPLIAASDSTLTPNLTVAQAYAETALVNAITINAPINGTHFGQHLLFYFADTGTPRAITWNAAYVGSPSATTVASTKLFILFEMDVDGTHWNVLADSGASSGGGANTALSNLASVAINTTLLTGASGIDSGSTVSPFRNLFLYGTGTYGSTSMEITGAPTANRVWTLQDASDTVVGRNTTDTLTNKTLTTPTITSLANSVAAHTVLSNNTASPAAPSFHQLACGDLSDGAAGCSRTYATSTITTTTTLSPATGNVVVYSATALNAAVTTINAPGGIHLAGDMLFMTLKDDGSTRALGGWDALYAASSDMAFPTATTAGKVLQMLFIYNPVNSKFVLSAILDNI